MAIRKGNSLFFDRVGITSSACAGGLTEAQTKYHGMFDYLDKDDRFGQENFELAESAMVGLTLQNLFERGGECDLIFGGDLTNQCIATNYGVTDFRIPVLGLYSACSTITEGLLIGAMAVDSGCSDKAACIASSHFCTAERQYRFPLQYGAVRTPTSQRTATACGGFTLERSKGSLKIKGGRIGTIEDKGITDANNMGGAMAYAAYATISGFLRESNTSVSDYDQIITGDLGQVGSEILRDLFRRDNLDISHRHTDCGALLYEGVDGVNSGGSGAGCSAAVMAGHILPKLRSGEWKDILFAATGALLSQTTTGQQRSIPSISHLVWIGA